MAIIFLCFILVVGLGCSSGETRLRPSKPGRLMAVPARSLAKCQSTEYIRAACPHKLPSVTSDYRRVLMSDESIPSP
ncbi:MAG TPA: hypothetical protein VFD47_04240 [Actinomycetota bacterium]|nr:hypothetical protein [Actinomycetota bacterium]